ncbi:N-methyl-D-aspartate receptor NMDAR2C subunit [Panacagrimonas sp.]|uniref:HD domain-containing protein n=1 Tax=Panacagrimonas sp. TaxID=2480088 RepID=UPI003B51E3CE
MSLARWVEPWEALGLNPRMELQAELRHRYSEPHRAYHTLHHLAECLQLLEQVRGFNASSAELELAIWFHDAVYNPRLSDNELRSADWARRELRRAGASVDLQDRVGALIMVTSHDGAPQTDDERLLSDIDLAILGSGPTRFDEYERQVRSEYQHVPLRLYRAGRRKILLDFQARPHLYFTPDFRETREATARANLQRSIERLSGKFW